MKVYCHVTSSKNCSFLTEILRVNNVGKTCCHHLGFTFTLLWAFRSTLKPVLKRRCNGFLMNKQSSDFVTLSKITLSKITLSKNHKDDQKISGGSHCQENLRLLGVIFKALPIASRPLGGPRSVRGWKNRLRGGHCL